MGYFKFISILLLVIVKMKKTNCINVCEDKHILDKRDLYTPSTGMWDNPIKYQIDSNLQNSAIKEALKNIEDNTCLRFNETNLSKNDTQGILFELSSTSCSSYIGLVDPNHTQTIKLTHECSSNKGTVLHEMGHALGLVHEHARRDRDKYVDINCDNVNENKKGNFLIRDDSSFKNFSTYYDYASIMHYSIYSFAKNSWTPVITSKLHKDYDKMMGQRINMTFNDLKRINLAYCVKCNITEETKKKEKEKKKKKEKQKENNKSKSKGKDNEKEQQSQNETGCRNSGYPNYNNCSECICPFGYTGQFCRKILQSDVRCGNTTFNVTKDINYYGTVGSMKCYIFLSTEVGKKINFALYYSNSWSRETCTEDVSHQVKFLKDKGMTGLLLCSWHREIINVTSESNSVFVYYNGQDSNHFIQMGFKQVD